jgi:hypothetical protein
LTSASHASAGLEAGATAGHGASPLVRAINWIVDRAGYEISDLSFENIVARSERRVRSSDWGSDDFFERLRLATRLVEADSRLTAIGRIAASVIYNWHAANRLRIVEYVKRHPHIPEIRIEKPIFIVGWYRTGTTNLHNLMGLDAKHRIPFCWELCYPLPQHADPVRDRRARIRRTAQKWRLADFMGPDQKYAHELRADGPEECFFMLANSAFFVQQIMGMTGYSYAHELLRMDVSGAYDDLRLQYQILSDQQPPGRRWIMKCPMHTWYLDDLMKVFPDARIIHTHRRAAEAIPSVCSLSAIMAQPMTADFDAVRHGAFFDQYCRSGIDRAIASRARIPSGQIQDVRLADLSRDAVGTVRRVYEGFDLPWSDSLPGQIESHLAAEERHRLKLGRRHNYTAEQFGLSEEKLTRDFADYEARFLAD